MGRLSAVLDLDPETGGDDDYAEVGRKRASRQLGGLASRGSGMENHQGRLDPDSRPGAEEFRASSS